MNQEEQKKKYSAFISDVSEILGLGKPIDVLKLCMVTDRFFKPLQNQVKELEKENAKLKTDYEVLSCSVGDFDELQDKLEEEQRKNNGLSDNLTKAKEHIENLLYYVKQCTCERSNYAEIEKDIKEAEQFLRGE